ncbi:TonB-dependent receptor [Pseudochryseolinea flava]|nr:TonB-dependent receptor [Pseudochryseolinea flava]
MKTMKIKFLLVLLLVSNMVFAQSITGIIFSNDQKPVVGAFVRVLNTNQNTLSDSEGKFSLSLSNGKYTLAISAIGFAESNQLVTVQDNAEPVRITLTESVYQLDDVIVTAEKEETDVQKVPYSISAISSKKVNDYRLWNIKDITAIVPTLYSANPGDNRNVTSIRGITSTSYDPAVATYVDGVNQFSLDTYIAQLFDVERIEVLRGPQGTLYGRNAMGGVINIITKQPTNHGNAFAELSAGTHGQQRYALGVRTPLVKNKLFFSASGIFDKTDGFYTNTYNDSDFDKRKSLTGNYFMTWMINPAWSATWNVKHSNNRNDGSFPLVISTEEAFNNPFKLEQDAITELVDDVFNASMKINHSGERITFTSLTTYQSNYRYYRDPIDADFSGFPFMTIVNNYGRDWNNVKVATQEFKLASPVASSSPLKWTAGVYSFAQQAPVKQGYFVMGQGEPDVTESDNVGAAVYGQITYTVGKFDVIGGLRYDYEEREMNIVDTQKKSTSYGALSPKVGATFHVNDNSQLYAAYTRGFRTGGISLSSEDVLFEFNPEYSNNFELSFKNLLFDHKVTFNAAAFYVIVNDIQVPTLMQEGYTVTRNAGKLTSKGLEFEVNATPVKGLQIDYNVGLTDATYNDLKFAGKMEDTDVVFDWDGHRQVFTPNVTSMLAVQYNYVDTEDVRLFVRAEWVTIGKQYFDLGNQIKQSSYHLANARIGVAFNGFEASLWGRNIGDKHYISYAYDFGGIHLGNPANYGITVKKSFSF